MQKNVSMDGKDNRNEKLVAALSDSKDRGICSVCVPGICGDRDRQCGERAGKGTAGDWENQDSLKKWNIIRKDF